MRKVWERHSDAAEAPRWVTKAGILLACLSVALLMMVTIAALLPRIPLLGPVGTILSGYSAWLAVLALVILGVCSVALVRARTPLRVVLAAGSAVAMVCAGVTAGGYVAVAASHGFAMNPFTLPLASAEPDDTDTYVTAAGEKRNIAIWRRSEPSQNPAGAPVAVFVHGGGWISGSELDNSGKKRWFADRGWLVYSVEYTLSSATQHRWDSTVDEVTCALSHIGQRAPSDDGDLSRLAVLGDSAGGNLALIASYRAAGSAPSAPCQDAVPPIDAVATVYPVVDIVGFHDNPDVLVGSTARSMSQQYTGGSPDEFPHRYAAVDPRTYVTADAPRTLILGPQGDHLVPPDGAVAFTELATRGGVDITYIPIPAAEHVFDSIGMGESLSLQLTHRWLLEGLS